MVSPGPIVNRKAEHLGTTDRGVVLIRRMLTNAINMTREGKIPPIPRLPEPERPVRTYAHEVVLRLPHPGGLADPKRLYQFGNRAAKAIIDADDIPAERRDQVARERIVKILEEACATAQA